MIGLELKINGEIVALAGGDDLGFLNGNISGIGDLSGKADAGGSTYFVTVHGRTEPNAVQDVNKTWIDKFNVRLNDEVSFTFKDVGECNNHIKEKVCVTSRTVDVDELLKFKMAKLTYFELKDKYEPSNS